MGVSCECLITTEVKLVSQLQYIDCGTCVGVVPFPSTWTPMIFTEYFNSDYFAFANVTWYALLAYE
jgi:hypothetical protein